MKRSLLAVPLLAALGACSTPVAGKNTPEADTAPAADDTKIKAVWRETKVGAAVGECHNIKPEETPMVKAAVDAQKSTIRKCFEEPVLVRGCRTGGIPAAFDAMLMIDTQGTVVMVRLVPGKNDMARTCDDAVRCVQEVLAQVQIQGLERFTGARQAYMTVTLQTPDESLLGLDAAAP